jgi:hypothetical protein
MATKRVQFTEWLPDQPANSGAIIDAKNVFPVSVGYQPFPSSEDYSEDAAEPLNSIFVAKFSDDVQAFAGSATKLYNLNNTTLALTDVSSTAYGGTSNWKFSQFGQTVLAVNNSSSVQAWTIGSSTAFADVATSPVAKYITTVRDFVVCGHLDGGSNANKIAWSDINDYSDWTPGATSQSDSQVLPDGGNITGLTGGEFGLVFLEKAIVRIQYTGSPLFFTVDTISRGLGCFEGNSIAQYGGTSFFLADDGFYTCDGQNVVGIGQEKVDRWFFDDCNLNELDSMSTAVDPIKKLVVWNYANVGGARSILIYNWQINKWSRAETVSTVVGNLASVGTTLEGLTDTLGYTDIDIMPASLDDRLWVGGKFLFAGAKDRKMVTFTGEPISPFIITSDLEVGFNSVVNLIRPAVDNGSADIAIASRKELDDTIEFGPTVSTTQDGRANVRSGGRYHRIQVNPTGNWTTCMAVDVDFIPQGNR